MEKRIKKLQGDHDKKVGGGLLQAWGCIPVAERLCSCLMGEGTLANVGLVEFL